MERIVVNIALDDYLKCVQFAHDSIETNLDEYSRRNQNRVHKILNDIIIGKVAEFGVYKYLSQKHKLEEPDLKIYDKNNKSFDADLKIVGYDIHVKSQSIEQAEKYGVSWSFQKEDQLTTNPTKKDVIFLCLVNDLEVIILNYGKASKYKGLYGEPIKESLKFSKKVLYFEKII
jgi:hypothetical protein